MALPHRLLGYQHCRSVSFLGERHFLNFTSAYLSPPLVNRMPLLLLSTVLLIGHGVLYYLVGWRIVRYQFYWKCAALFDHSQLLKSCIPRYYTHYRYTYSTPHILLFCPATLSFVWYEGALKAIHKHQRSIRSTSAGVLLCWVSSHLASLEYNETGIF